MYTCSLTWPTLTVEGGKTRIMDFPKRPSRTLWWWNEQNRDVKWTGGGVTECTITAFPVQLKLKQSVTADGSAVVVQVELNSNMHLHLLGNDTCEGFFWGYLSRSDGSSVQQGQQRAQGCGSDSGGSTASTPHQVGQQDVRQKLLWLFLEMPIKRQRLNYNRKRIDAVGKTL